MIGVVMTEVRCPSCVVCGHREVLTLPADRVGEWRAGMLVQRAFPEMTVDDRELLISGTHPKCWKVLEGLSD
jgi:hypothetical protein